MKNIFKFFNILLNERGDVDTGQEPEPATDGQPQPPEKPEDNQQQPVVDPEKPATDGQPQPLEGSTPTPEPPVDEPKKPEWWEAQGFKSESAAIESQKELRKYATQTSMENAKLKRRNEIIMQYHNDQLDADSIEELNAIISKEEAEIEQKALRQHEQMEIARERGMLAIEAGKGKYPEIVIDENLPELLALSQASSATTPFGKLEDAVKSFQKIRGMHLPLSKDKQKEVTDKQVSMKNAAARTEAPSGRQDQPEKGAWDMSPEEFRKHNENVLYG